MSDALSRAYASNTETPIDTISLSHSLLSTVYLVNGYVPITVTLEDSSTQIFTPQSIGFLLPSKGVTGRQDLTIRLENASRAAFAYVETVLSSSEPLICTYRPYLESDLSAPSGGIYELSVNSATIDRESVVFSASYSPLPDIAFPRLRYYTNDYPSLKYV